MIRLVLCDIDNTLIPMGESHATPRTVRAIHRLLDSGIRFGPDTGRDVTDLRGFFEGDESCLMTGIFSNGKRVRVYGAFVSEKLLSRDMLVSLDEVLRDEDGMFVICFPAIGEGHASSYGVCRSARELDFYRSHTKPGGQAVDAVPDDVDFIAAVVGCLGVERMDRCRQIVAEAAPDAVIVSPVPEWFDVLHRGVSKATALDELLDALGVGLDEVVVFGDSENDLDILRKVPFSVAVANATDETKRVARYRVGACADEGVADALLEIERANRAGTLPAFLKEAAHD